MLNLLIIIISAVALLKSVDMFIESSSKLAHKLKISAYTISFLLVAIGTSLPETAIAISSGLQKNTILSFGDAIGSNIALLTLVIAIPAIFGKGVSTRTALRTKDIYYTAMFSALPLGLLVDGTLTRFDGILLLVGYFLYAYAVLKRARGIENILDSLEHPNIMKNLLEFVLSLAVLVGSSHLLVKSAISISAGFGVELGLIGLTITAIGTSLPEIAFSIKAIQKNKNEQILGDIIGSVVANSTLVLGTAAVFHPIELMKFHAGLPTILAFILILLFFLRFARTRETISRSEGLGLLFMYGLFILMEMFFS
jgi:cation:H+ antiporter